MQSKTRGLSLGVDWSHKDNVQILTRRASGLFVWASTASEFIDGYDPKKCIDIILRGDAELGSDTALDALYRTALESAGDWNDDTFIADFTTMIGIVLVARYPLSSSAIDLLLSLPRKPVMHVHNLSSRLRLTTRPTVRLLHPSFGDFLMTKLRCGRDV